MNAFETLHHIVPAAVTFFLVTNPIGNSPAILALIKNFDFQRQRIIMLREGFLALLVALFFQYLGEPFLSLLAVKNYSVTLCGGLILFLVALRMIFSLSEPNESEALQQEPFLVPIATPLLSGPGLLTMIMLKSHLESSHLIISLSILLAWVGVLAVMIIAPYLQRLLGIKGMLALEQLMGLLLAMIGLEMLVNGVKLYMDTLG